ncbi:MAG: DUF1080 domain-containing protein, partial [Planctomycetota bacterium]
MRAAGRPVSLFSVTVRVCSFLLATSIIHIMLLKNSCILAVALLLTSTVVAEEPWQNLITPGSLKGWKKVGGDASYEIKDGVITGTTGQGKNTFLTKGPFADFELEFTVKCDAPLNSGVQFRSHLYPKATPQESRPKRIREKGEMYGYQCEIRSDVNAPNGCAGNVWDEGRRTKWMDTNVKAAAAQKAYNPSQWNRFRIRANGDHLQTFVNGVKVADFHDDQAASVAIVM